MSEDSSTESQRQLQFHTLQVTADLELLVCGQCFGMLTREFAGQHVNWHFDAGKKISEAGSPFGAMSALLEEKPL